MSKRSDSDYLTGIKINFIIEKYIFKRTVHKDYVQNSSSLFSISHDFPTDILFSVSSCNKSVSFLMANHKFEIDSQETVKMTDSLIAKSSRVTIYLS